MRRIGAGPLNDLLLRFQSLFSAKGAPEGTGDAHLGRTWAVSIRSTHAFRLPLTLLGWLSSPRCKELKYSKELPQISIIFIFVNEALSVILRSVHSAVNHTPTHLLKEIILVDDNSDEGTGAAELHECFGGEPGSAPCQQGGKCHLHCSTSPPVFVSYPWGIATERKTSGRTSTGPVDLEACRAVRNK